MSQFLYFSGETELQPKSINRGKFGVGSPVGTPVGFVPTYDPMSGWTRGYLPVTRTVEYKSNPSRHKCDVRCTNATGRVMRCECACGGKNHGRGSVVCEAA